MSGILALVVMVVVGFILLKLAFKLLGVLIAIALGVAVFFLAEKLMGKGR